MILSFWEAGKMSIDSLVMEEIKKVKNEDVVAQQSYGSKGPYSLFVEQYLERPITTGIEPMAGSPTVCSIKSIPVIDDF